MTDTTFNQVFLAVKTHAAEILTEYDEPVPDEGAYDRIIENALIQLFADIQEDVGQYNKIIHEIKFDPTVELIEIEDL